MTILFDKKLAELDAYLQMLIEQTENIDKKIELSYSEAEKDGLQLIRNNLESLLGSIKHAIVLLQIAKVSIKTTSQQKVTTTSATTKAQSTTSLTSSTNSTTDSKSLTLSTTAAITASLQEQQKQLDQNDDDDKVIFYDAPDEQQEPNMLSQEEQPNEDGSIDWDALYEEEELELGSLENQGSVIKHLLSQIRIGMDLTKVVLPTFILERRSLLEMYADFFAHPDLFSSITDYETPEERMVQLVRWYLSAFHAGRKSSVAKKPYNPILGEIFLCHWNLDETNNNNNNNINSQESAHKSKQFYSTHSNQEFTNSSDQSNSDIEKFSKQLPKNSLLFVAEQVSHHPPVSAFYAENPDKLISCCAHIYTKSKYLGLSVGVHNVGHGVINLLKHNETYVCTFPSAYGRNILGSPWVELGGPVNISCEQTGYSANIEFVTKPFYGGKKHRVIGEILRPNKEPFISIDGEWNGCMYSKSPPTSNDKQVFVETTCLPVIKKHVRSISSQESFESRNVWKEVTRALKLRDVVSATEAKSFIEQKQRDMHRDRMEKGVKWKTRYFEAADEGWDYAKPLAVRKPSTT